MTPTLRRLVLGVIAAVAVTTAMDATGLSAFSALPLCPLMVLLWYRRPPRLALGFRRGHGRHYALALLHPAVVIGSLAFAAGAAGAFEVSSIDWSKAVRRMTMHAVATLVVVLVTEEGFFRGWLWASLERARMSPTSVLGWTSFAFVIWHLSAVLLDTGFNPPISQVPLFIVNAFVLGAIWGMLRGISGSIVVASVSHSVWNALAYGLFGFGSTPGALGIENTAVWGPEVGVLGIPVNIACAWALWRWWKGGATGSAP
jgi:membrane protease YdiL (CAAX protease family)